MTNSNKFPLLARGRQREPLVAAVIAAALLLTGCSGATTPAATSAASSSAVASAAAATTSATAAPTAGATPTAETATKALVQGFPTTLIPVMKGAQVQASSLQRSTPLAVASLTATVTAKPAAVLAYYTKVYLAQKFTALPGSTVDGTPSKTFVRSGGTENVNVAVIQTGTTSTVTVGANIFPASLK